MACTVCVALAGCSSFAPTKLAEATLDPVKLANEPLDLSHVVPSNVRQWEPDQIALASAEIDGDRVRVHNIRNNIYVTKDHYATQYYDKTFDLSRLQTVDFIVVPFQEMPSLAHTMLSFGFAGEEYVAVSAEVRKEMGESYSALKGLLGEYELMYVVGDERDLVALRSNYREDEVYLYRTKATPEQAKELFLDVFQRVNKLKKEPEFYHTITNNCTTNIAAHVDHLSPSRVPLGLRLLLAGRADKVAYDLGLLDTSLPFEMTQQQARVTELARASGDRADFSRQIRIR
jgi:Domain of unknown function (DUF4105)